MKKSNQSKGQAPAAKFTSLLEAIQAQKVAKAKFKVIKFPKGILTGNSIKWPNNFTPTRNTAMKIKDFSCTLNTPDAYEASEHDMTNHGLPPYAPRPAYSVDEYPKAPASWMRGGADVGSFFVPVQTGKGMWLDFNQNYQHKHHVAVLLSIQGVNPITGPIPGIDPNEVGLFQFRKKCPRHNKPFGADRFCSECGFKWPAQNYMATTGTPEGRLWLDGFRSDDGNIRQYVITPDEARGVAAQTIGDKCVFFIKAAFYISKDAKPPRLQRVLRATSFGGGGAFGAAIHHDEDYLCDSKEMTFGASLSSSAPKARMRCCASLESRPLGASLDDEVEIEPDKLHIAAGARISQQIYDDPEKLEFWRPSPEAVLYIMYCSEKKAEQIMKAGKRAEKADGWLQEVKKGN